MILVCSHGETRVTVNDVISIVLDSNEVWSKMAAMLDIVILFAWFAVAFLRRCFFDNQLVEDLRKIQATFAANWLFWSTLKYNRSRHETEVKSLELSVHHWAAWSVPTAAFQPLYILKWVDVYSVLAQCMQQYQEKKSGNWIAETADQYRVKDHLKCLSCWCINCLCHHPWSVPVAGMVAEKVIMMEAKKVWSLWWRDRGLRSTWFRHGHWCVECCNHLVCHCCNKSSSFSLRAFHSVSAYVLSSHPSFVWPTPDCALLPWSSLYLMSLFCAVCLAFYVSLWCSWARWHARALTTGAWPGCTCGL